jgi:hypothetical protein
MKSATNSSLIPNTLIMIKTFFLLSLFALATLIFDSCNRTSDQADAKRLAQRKELDSMLLHEVKIPVKSDLDKDIFVKTEDSNVNNDTKHGVITSETRRITTTFEKYVAFDPNAPSLYPGALVQGKELGNGILTPITTARNPLTITVSDFYSKGSLSLSRTVLNPTLGNINDSLHAILKQGFNSEQPAKMSFSQMQVFSMDQAFLALNASYKWATGSLDGSFSTTKNDKYSKFLVRFVEKYFTVSCEPPSSPSSYIADNANYENLKNYLNDKSGPNPLCYVSSVTYGRELWVLIESSENASEVRGALNASFGGLGNGGSASITAGATKILQESTVQSFIMGGQKKAARDYLSGDKITGISNFLKAGSKMDESDPPQPISYTVSYLSDNSLARVSVSTDYTVITDKTVDAPSPLASATITFAQGNDGKDQSTGLRVYLFDNTMLNRDYSHEIDAIAPQAIAYTDLWDDTQRGVQFTDNGTKDLSMGLRKNTTNVNLKNGVLVVWMFPHGHDRWQFTPTVHFIFKNGTTKDAHFGGCDLDQNNGFGAYPFEIN